LFGVQRALIGVIHAQALPGTPGNRLAVSAIAKMAAAEAETYADAGFHGLILENTHDRPYVKGAAVGQEIATAMSVVGNEIRRATPLPLGIQILAGANRSAMAAAHACGAAFVRVYDVLAQPTKGSAHLIRTMSWTSHHSSARLQERAAPNDAQAHDSCFSGDCCRRRDFDPFVHETLEALRRSR
jgi:predicted TIM-barrel enzyme